MKNQINVKKIKKILTIEDHKNILLYLKIPIFSEDEHKIIYYSGEKNKNALSGSPKLYFYKDSKIYIGYTSGCSMDIISLVQKRLNLLKEPSSFLDAINLICKITGLNINTSKFNSVSHIYDWESDLGKFLRFKQTGTVLLSYDDTILSQLDHSIPQPWLDEGISQDSLIKYQIGYYERLNATTIPCRDRQGKLIGIRCRYWQPEEIEQGKYRPLTLLDGTTFKFPTNSILYGLNYNWPEIERTGTVYIGEGEKFVLKMDTWFHEKSCAVAMFGGSLGLKRRNDLVKLGVKRVVLVPDNDWIDKGKEKFDEWQKKIQKQIDLWNGYASVEVVWDNGDTPILEPKQNATDQTLDIWNRLYENREICS